ncbi:hypothetical protein RRG08_017756 [Elysia crispata]|uniref:G-protein coupled receptors family 1 profile domain-containing protein n=1 Tax=Elysia crispata TaxID=231223 RepID=A0AAE0XR72_9GAST|nr:hypothetical protein RRG08_017756 [Elysia crispata]
MCAENFTAIEKTVNLKSEKDIGDTAMFYVGLVLKMYLNPALGVSGIFINIINTGIFYNMGLSDGVSQNFLILSVFDGVLAAAASVNSVCYILLETVFTRGGKTAENLQTVFWSSIVAWPFSQIVSCVTTAVIAVVRCCCVALPLRVKRVLTARRQLAVIVLFSASFDGILLYVFSSGRFVHILDAQTNVSNIFLIGQDYGTLNIFTNIFFYTNFAVVVICLAILTINLGKASKFRQLSTASQLNTEKPKEKSRETRIVQTVTLVSAIFVLYNVPTIVQSILRQFLYGFSSRGQHKNLYNFFLVLIETTMLLNVDVNIFIYLSYNSRYRTIFTNMLTSNNYQTK